jgi:hypothetical protein
MCDAGLRFCNPDVTFAHQDKIAILRSWISGNTNTALDPHSAIREGDIKLIGKKPQEVAELYGKLKTWLKENVSDSYFPKPNPSFDPKSPDQPFSFEDLK